jgi:thiamine-monophosphate kinase
VLTAVTVPRSSAEEELLQLMSGVGAAAESAGAAVLGGDLSSGPEWSLAVTVVGRARRPITRAGARAGDQVWVTGALGGSRAALEVWRRKGKPGPESRRRYAQPEPRLVAGRWLAEHGARAMIDLSDGLAGDAAHLAAASEAGVEIDLARIPFSPEVEPEAKRLGRSPEEFAAEGGEDFELLVALPAEFDRGSELERSCGIPLTQIGKVTSGSGARFLLEGKPVRLSGFNHFG